MPVSNRWNDPPLALYRQDLRTSKEAVALREAAVAWVKQPENFDRHDRPGLRLWWALSKAAVAYAKREKKK